MANKQLEGIDLEEMARGYVLMGDINLAISRELFKVEEEASIILEEKYNG